MGDTRRERLRGIDALRGLTVVSMVLYHLMYDIYVIGGLDPDWYRHAPVHLWQQSICWSFILISGFVWSWGRKRAISRGARIFALGLAITAVTLAVMPGQRIIFGVLSLLGSAVVLTLLLDRPLRGLPPLLGLILCALIFCLTRHISQGYISLGGLFSLELPRGLYSWWLMPLGLPPAGFFSADYFPLLPWYALYLCGYFLYRLLEPREGWRSLLSFHVPGLDFLGRKALWVYVLHQPVCYLLSLGIVELFPL